MDLLTWETALDMEEELLFLNLSPIFFQFPLQLQNLPSSSQLTLNFFETTLTLKPASQPWQDVCSLDPVPGVVLLSPGSAAFSPLWEEHRVSRLTSCCCSTLIALLFFIAVVNVLLYLTNELNSERHADREQIMACVVWGTWCFRHPVSPRNKSLQDEGVAACPFCLWPKFTSY